MDDKYLNIFLYYLIDKSEILTDLEDEFIAEFEKNYTYSEKNKIIDSLNWAQENNKIDFRSRLPGITIKNSEILKSISSILTKIN